MSNALANGRKLSAAGVRSFLTQWLTACWLTPHAAAIFVWVSFLALMASSSQSPNTP